MTDPVRCSALCLALFGVVMMSGFDTAVARGSAANTMDSPGYQRALQESRKRLQQQEPSMAPPAASPRPSAAPRHGRRPHRHHPR